MYEMNSSLESGKSKAFWNQKYINMMLNMLTP